MGCISFSYYNNVPLFHGFALIAVPFYTIVFIGIFSTISVYYLKIIKLLKQYSFDIYLTQGIAFSILLIFELNDWCFMILSLILSLILGIINHKLTLFIR